MRERWMYKMSGAGRRARLLVLAAVMVAAAVFWAAGCTRRTGTEEIPTDTGGAAGIESSSAESSDIGPESQEPSTIESFPTSESETEPVTPEETEPEIRWEKTAIVATDIHYLARSLTDGGSSFRYMVEHGDGKVVTYIEQIVDAFLEEVIAQKPDMLILSGDLTLDGEKKSHEELAGSRRRIRHFITAPSRAGLPIM